MKFNYIIYAMKEEGLGKMSDRSRKQSGKQMRSDIFSKSSRA